ncbi:hypothetical protein H2200_003854 [Cladophialophora chaetospira]|uniref:Uncharacterized protein n=1 Tax=Cladophialophora chaetospira TaxID=386627 RepID=A0AA38XF45_9EURO|nr:hypothetical protein H2200_003854 [Cladophialophora chaetospira]
MPQTKGFTIFARASTPTSPYKTYSTSIRMPSPPPSDDEQSIASGSSNNSIKPSSATTSTTTVSSTSPGVNTPSRKSRIDFSRLENIFAPDDQSELPSTALSLWYILTTALLLAFHKEKLIGELWTYLSSRPELQSDEDLLSTARHVREACLKASTLVGFPRAINALLALQTAISSSHPILSATLSRDESLRSSALLSPAEKFSRGMALFSRIYDKHTPRVISTMSACSGGDLTHFAIHSIYGELLAESAVIGDMETGVLEFVCCLADGVAPQAKGHFYGSRNLGATDGVLRRSVVLTGETARMLGVGVPWEDGEEEERGEWRFLERVV